MTTLALQSIVQVFKDLGASSRVDIDTGSFSLHYHATTSLFVAFGGLLFTTSLIISPLRCQPVSDPAPATTDVINAFCWATSTFSLPAPEPDTAARPPGSSGSGTFSELDQRRRHGYYPWVAFLLMVQGLLFYLPHWLWHILEDKQLVSILQDSGTKMAEKEPPCICLDNVVTFLRRTRGQHLLYFCKYLACETLNLANAVGGIFMIDAYLGGGFHSYGPRVLGFISRGGRPSPMDEQFPKMTACRVSLPDRDGSARTTDAVCVLSMNMLYDKVYLLLWFWLVVVAAVSGGNLIHRLVVMSSSALRAVELRRKAPLADPADVTDLSNQLDLGDLFLLSLIAENIDAGTFKKLAAALNLAMTKRPALAESAVIPKMVTDSSGVFRRPESSVSPAP